MSAAFWFRYIVRSLRREGRRALFALVCITVGVAAIVALQTASLTVQRALTSNVRAANGGDISVTADATPLGRSDLSIFQRLQRQGKISAWTAVSSLHATAIGPHHDLVPFDVNVVSVPPYPLGGQPTFVTPSNSSVAGLLQHSGDVLITSVLQDELGVNVGDSLTVNTIGGRGLQATVRGVLAETSFEHSAVMTVSSRDTAVLSSTPPRYVAVYADTLGPVTSVAAALRAQFPVAQVQTVQEAMQSAQTQVHDFRQFMLLVGLLALLIAGIGILNAMQSMLAWRRLEIAMLKALGYGQGTLYALFGGEAVLLGLLGGILGAAGGAVASKIISDALARAMAIQVDFQFDPGTLVGGVALGIGATLIFALLPIVRGARLRPLELLREGAGMSSLSGWPGTIGLLAVAMLLFAGLAAGIMGDVLLALEFVGGACGAALLLAGLFALTVGGLGRLGPPTSRPFGIAVLVILIALALASWRAIPSVAPLLAVAVILWGATVILPRGRLLPLLIALRSLSRRRARTSVTLVAFLVGVLAMSITLTVALNLQSQINDALASNSSANLVAVATTANQNAVVVASRRLPGIKHWAAITTVSTRPVLINGKPVTSDLGQTAGSSDGEDNPARFLGGITGLDLKGNAQPDNVRIVSGSTLTPADAGTNHILVNRELMFPPWNLSVGDKITLRESSSGTEKTVQVVGFYTRPRRRGFASFFRAPVYADRSLPIALGGGDAQAIVSFNVDPNQLTHDATTLQHAVSGVLILNIGDLTRVIETILNELLNLLAVITALALGSSLAVVANGVALAMLERRREIALFKAIGFGPRNVLQFVLVENALAGTLAGAASVLAVAIALGLLSRLALQQAIGFDPVVAVLVLAGATVLAVLTAYATARGPISIRPLEALRNE